MQGTFKVSYTVTGEFHPEFFDPRGESLGDGALYVGEPSNYKLYRIPFEATMESVWEVGDYVTIDGILDTTLGVILLIDGEDAWVKWSRPSGDTWRSTIKLHNLVKTQATNT